VIHFPLKPIRSETELDDAIRMTDSLLAKKSLLPEEEDYLEVLGDLVERYESQSHPITPLSDADRLQHLLEARDVTLYETAQATGIDESTLSEVLSGTHALNRDHIGRLARYFKVSPEVFAF
jgi:HTH-type transcriptional regulator / antitoxin HigA